MRFRVLLAVAITAVAVAALPSAAGATDYCVGHTTACNTGSIPATGDGFANTLQAAKIAGGDNRIFLAPTTYNLETGIPNWTLNSGTSLQIIGAGSATTKLTCQLATLGVCFGLTAPSTASSVSGLTVDATASGSVTNTYGLSLTRAQGSDLAVIDEGGMSGFRALSLYYGAAADGCAIKLASSNAVGVFTNNSDLSVSHCSISGAGGSTYGIEVGGDDAPHTFNVDHCRIVDVTNGVAITVGTLNVSDTLIDLGALVNSTGISAYYPNSANHATALNADRVTVVGTATNQYGAYLGASGTNQPFSASIDDSVIYNPSANFKSILTTHTQPTGASTVTVTRTAFDPAKVSTAGGDPITPTVAGAINLGTVSPGFADVAARDYRPGADSVLVDAGADASAFAPGALDVAGSSRAVDGNGDGVLRADLGAYEFQPPAPGGSPTALTPTAKITARPKKSFKVGKNGGFAKARKGAASFSVRFANSARAKFSLRSIGKHKKLKSVKGSQTLNVSDGTIKIGFRGKWNKKQLKAGRYRVTITPVSSTGATGKPVTVDFTLK